MFRPRLFKRTARNSLVRSLNSERQRRLPKTCLSEAAFLSPEESSQPRVRGFDSRRRIRFSGPHNNSSTHCRRCLRTAQNFSSSRNQRLHRFPRPFTASKEKIALFLRSDSGRKRHAGISRYKLVFLSPHLYSRRSRSSQDVLRCKKLCDTELRQKWTLTYLFKLNLI